MTKFLNGPAEGQVLALRRVPAPIFLRVVFDRTDGTWDALDQWEDSPKQTEDVHVYWLSSVPSFCHIKSGKPGASGFFAMAEYRLCPNQPNDNQARNNSEWVKWVDVQAQSLYVINLLRMWKEKAK